jgi:RHS repeat-associated protein
MLAGYPPGETRPGGVSVIRVYDNLGRMSSETGSGVGVSTASRTFGYDPGGRPVTAGNQTFTYDPRGMIKTVTGGTQGASSFDYDIVGRMNKRVDAAGTTTFGYNDRSNLTSIVAGVTTTGYSWLPSGELDQVTYPQAVSRKYVYDDLGRPTDDTVKTSAATVISRRQYTYNPDSSVATSTITQTGNTAAGAYTYTYDKGSRLIGANGPGGMKTFTYDPAGNRTAADGQTFTYDQRNRMLTGAGTTYNWTARGTLASTTGIGAATYSFDGLDRQTQAGPVTYTYDTLDRVTTRTNGATTTFGYAGTETDPVTDGTATYTRTPTGAVHGVTRAGTLVLAGSDRHGDVTFTINPATGVVADTTVRDPFGKTLGATGATPAVGYQGDWTDPSNGLVWMAARWYNPNTGTFTTRDTHAGQPGTYATLNKYTYALNNPLTYNDPTGHDAGSFMPGFNEAIQDTGGWNLLWKTLGESVTHKTDTEIDLEIPQNLWLPVQPRAPYRNDIAPAGTTDASRAAETRKQLDRLLPGVRGAIDTFFGKEAQERQDQSLKNVDALKAKLLAENAAREAKIRESLKTNPYRPGPGETPFLAYIMAQVFKRFSHIMSHANTYGYCGVAGLDAILGGTGEGCVADDGNKLYAVGQFEGGLGYSASAYVGVVGFVSTAVNAKDLGGHSICFSGSAFFAGIEVCLGLNRHYTETLFAGDNFESFEKSLTGNDTIAFSATLGIGGGIQWRAGWTTVGELVDYPDKLHILCGSHVLTKPTIALVAVIPVCSPARFLFK